jgi:hypothetical protein
MPMLAAAALQSCTNILAFIDTGESSQDVFAFSVSISRCHAFPAAHHHDALASRLTRVAQSPRSRK